jgi:methionyl-tRNA formyltransferase
MLKREDGLIDWSMDAFAIERRVRGFQPWPNAYTTFSSRRLIIWQATAERNEQLNGSPGQIIEAHGDNIRVACGNNAALRVLELQPENGRPMSARDFLNGTHLKVGEILGRG